MSQAIGYDMGYSPNSYPLPHTFKFAKKAAAEGMPVIDDPGSILRCTNKAFLAELLRENGIATPPTRLVSRRTLARFEDTLSYPVVLKVPDGSFSRDVKKAQDFRQFKDIAQAMFKDSEIVLVQDFMYTAYDWRVGVLAGEPLFVARYHMVRDHWQIMKHSGAGQSTEGRTEAVAIHDTPKCVLDTAISAARLIGDGFYGVDLKQTEAGAFVIEINDNPNLDVGAEDKVLGDEVYPRLLAHLLARFEGRNGAEPAAEVAACALPSAARFAPSATRKTLQGLLPVRCRPDSLSVSMEGVNPMASSTMRIATWLQPQQILIDVDVRDRTHALEIVGAQIGREHGLKPEPIFRALWRREQAASTGLGEGFAIPHARIDGIPRPLTLFIRTKVAIEFDAPDRKPVSQLLAIMVPADGAKDDHLQLLALVAQLFSDRDFRKQLYGAPDVAAAADAFRAGIARVTAASK
jgi:glutathione synthase/RimK-type ligase-like ATP-grasp enzyme/mannitol/fructose-specific phosphotransferase system IIA component (Ntr-type)